MLVLIIRLNDLFECKSTYIDTFRSFQAIAVMLLTCEAAAKLGRRFDLANFGLAVVVSDSTTFFV